MNILIIDDDKNFITSLKEKIFLRISEYNDRTEFYLYNDSNPKIFTNKYEIAFIDIDLNLKASNGINIAEMVREMNPFCYIVFVSARNDLIHSSLRVQPFFFIRKSNFKSDFEFFWYMFQEKIKNFEILTLSYDSRHCAIYPLDILYVEAFDHISCIHTRNKILYDNRTLTDFYSILPKECFLQIHRSVVINLKYMTSFNSNTIYLGEKYKFNIGRSYKDKCKNAIKEYLLR